MPSLFAVTRTGSLFASSLLKQSSSSSALSLPIAYRWFGSGSVRAQRHRRLVKFAKGYRGRSKNCFRIAIRAVTKAWTYAYRDRRTKKRVWRRLWIQRLNAATRQYAVSYSSFIYRLKTADVELNRKVLSELAATEPFAFKACVDVLERQNRLYVEERRRQKQQLQAEDEAMAA